MTEPTTASVIAITSVVSLSSFINGVDASALVGAIGGAAVYMSHSKDIGNVKKVVYAAISIFVGYRGADDLAEVIPIHDFAVTGFIVSAVCVTAVTELIDRIKTMDFGRFFKKGDDQ